MHHPFREKVVNPQSFLQIHQKLCASYQIKVPSELSRTISFLFSLVYDNEYIRPEEDLYNSLVPAFNWCTPLDGERVGWDGPPTPVEFFSFATPAVDGIEYGFVVHAPELAREDYPVAEFDPKDDLVGLRLLGNNFSSGLEVLLSRALASQEDNPALWEEITPPYNTTPQITLNRVHALAAHLGIYPSKEGASPWIFDSQGPNVVPITPKGWRYKPSLDGVGVLAPALFFGEYPEIETIETHYDCDLEPALSFVSKALQEEYPASALLVLRDAIFQNAYLDEQLARLWAPTAQAYRALNRPLFALCVEEAQGGVEG